MSDIEGSEAGLATATRVGATERGQRRSFKFVTRKRSRRTDDPESSCSRMEPTGIDRHRLQNRGARASERETSESKPSEFGVGSRFLGTNEYRRNRGDTLTKQRETTVDPAAASALLPAEEPLDAKIHAPESEAIPLSVLGLDL